MREAVSVYLAQKRSRNADHYSTAFVFYKDLGFKFHFREDSARGVFNLVFIFKLQLCNVPLHTRIRKL
jgi:hypothetical protein